MTATAERVSFFFSAHPDDWQLFMNPPAFKDARDEKCRCVFIHMSAGDAGFALAQEGRKHPFYLAREHGAEAAIRAIAGAGEGADEPDVAVATFNGHAIRHMRYRNTAAYFLRLPDGRPSGTGYPTTGHQSLNRLANGAIATLTAVDGSAVYRGWRDLTLTLRAIIDLERAPERAVKLHVPELDPALNANDHADHYMTAKAALDAVAGLPARVVHHVGYASRERPENLPKADRETQRAVYDLTLRGVAALGHHIPWPEDLMFIGRNYYRVEDRLVPAAGGGPPVAI